MAVAAPITRSASTAIGPRLTLSRRDKREVDHMGSLEHRISLMSPEQRRARLLELQAKAALVIEGEATEVEEERNQVLRSRRADRGIS